MDLPKNAAARVVVTGGAGFIGANLCRELAARGHRITVIDDLSTGDARNVDGLAGVELVRASILDDGALARAFARADSVVHLAARVSVAGSIADPVGTHAVNVDGTVAVLEAARHQRVGHVVVASSAAVYGADPPLPTHEDVAADPASPYAASKLAAEAVAFRSGLAVLALRFFNVFGPLQGPGHDYAAVVPAFVDAALAGRPLPVHGDGGQSRDFTFVGSVAAVLADAVERRTSHDGPLNLAFGSRVTLLELIAELEAVLGHPLEREHLPTRPGDVRRSQADRTRFRRHFPDATPVPLTDGLRRTVDWFRDRP